MTRSENHGTTACLGPWNSLNDPTMSDTTILVIEDDPAIRSGLVDVLEYAGYQTLEAAEGHTGMQLALQANYRLLLLDLVLPGPSGFEILTAIKRKRPGQAVIILSARGEENDRVRGLTIGADDYVVKPFSMKELLARVDAVLRRTCERSAPLDERSLPGGSVDFKNNTLTFTDGRHEDLSEREGDLLKYLLDSQGRIVSREEILRNLWGLDPARTETRTIDMHIMHLRTKLGDKDQSLLATVRGKGYRWTA
jgi:DNA-binding response OmpR family regulator